VAASFRCLADAPTTVTKKVVGDNFVRFHCAASFKETKTINVEHFKSHIGVKI
jgi:hypothetical protein